MTTARFNRLAGAIAQATARVYEAVTAGEKTGTVPCPKCGAPVRFTATEPHRSTGQCSTAGCVRWQQ